MTRWPSLLLLVASVSLAQAQPGTTAPTSVTAPTPSGSRKTPATAMALSIGTTLAGTAAILASDGNETVILLGAGAMYVGPSTGHWYAGRVGTIGLVSRAAGAVLIYKGFGLLDQQGYDCLGYTDAECREAEARWDREAKRGGVMFYSGLALWIGSSVFDVVMAGHAANAWNREHNLVVTPTMMPAAGGRAPGVSLQLTF
jgi:pimeloyl-ACP methyl ester carboxylesterase